MNVKVRGISYYLHMHQEYADLPNLVLLHGFMGSGYVFDHLIDDLKTFCNPITIDLLGHGRSEGAELHYQFSTKEQIAGLAHLLKYVSDDPLFLHGYSMGGRLALQYALMYSTRLNGLILESTTFGIEHEQERAARQSLDAERADRILGNYSSFLQEWASMPLFKGSGPNNVVEMIQLNQNPQWMANSLLGFGTGTMPCVKNQLHTISAPTLLLAGEHDIKFRNINSAMAKQIHDCTLHVIPNSGHRVHIDNPTKFVHSIQTFIESNYTL